WARPFAAGENAPGALQRSRLPDVGPGTQDPSSAVFRSPCQRRAASRRIDIERAFRLRAERRRGRARGDAYVQCASRDVSSAAAVATAQGVGDGHRILLQMVGRGGAGSRYSSNRAAARLRWRAPYRLSLRHLLDAEPNPPRLLFQLGFLLERWVIDLC